MERKQLDEFLEVINGEVHAIKEQRRYLHEGKEYPDPTPLAPPLGYKKQPTLAERMREMIRIHMSDLAQQSGAETFEEADDFEVGDDYDPTSPYEEVFDPGIRESVSDTGGQAQPAATGQQAGGNSPQGSTPPASGAAT